MDGSKKYIVQLSPDARRRLEGIARNGAAPAKKILHARILLMSDQHHPSGRYHDHQIAATLGVHLNTVARVRKLFVLYGEQPAVDRKVRLTPPVPPKVDGKVEAILVAVCCSKPPEGQKRWTLSLLADELVGRRVVTCISRETVRKTLKKTCLLPGENSDSASPNATWPGSSRRWSRSWTSTRSRLTTTSR